MAAVPCSLSGETMMPFALPACEWLPFSAAFQPCWWHLFWALKAVSDYCTLLRLSLLTTLVSALQFVSGCCALLHFYSPDILHPFPLRLWVSIMPCLTVFQTCWYICPWLSREWVAAMPCCISNCLMTPIFALQSVSHCCILLYLKLSHSTCPPLSRG